MIWEDIGTYAVGVLLLIGAAFVVIGGFGLLRLGGAMSRLHAPTKVGTMGIGALLLASMVYSYFHADIVFGELLIAAFLFVTAPISANFISKVNIHQGHIKPLPDAPEGERWSTVRDAENGDDTQT